MRKAVVIHPEGNVNDNPSLTALFQFLKSREIEIVYAHESRRAIHRVPGATVEIFTNQGLAKIKRFIINYLQSAWLIRLLVRWQMGRLAKHATVVIGIDQQGIVEARALAHHLRCKLVLWSFEITFRDEVPARLKTLERQACEHIHFAVVQDKERARLLCAENNISPTKCCLIPVAGASRIQNIERIDSLRESLQIASSMKVAIMIGSIADWTCAKDILQSVKSWPSEWCLIIHGRYGNTEKDIQLLNIREELEGSRIYISAASQHSYDGLHETLAGIDAGIAFYMPTYRGSGVGRNIKHIGLSSGKIATYLQYGIPVVSNVGGEMGYLIEASRAGRTCTTSADIGDALEYLTRNSLSQNAKDLFDRRLCFDNYSSALWTELCKAPQI